MPRKVKKMSPKVIDVNRNKGFAIIAAVLVGILVVVLGTLIFTGGKGNDGKKGISAQESEGDSTGSEEGETTTTTTGISIEQVDVPPLSINRRRNPFKPLLDKKRTIACEIEEAAPVEPLGGGIVTVPPELERGRTGPAETGEPEVVSTIVTLEDIYEDDGKLYASIRVADQLFAKVVEGETFAENYKLLVLDRVSGATVLFGDERFSFFVGQSIYW